MDEDSPSLKGEGYTPPPDTDQDVKSDTMRSSPIQFIVHNVCKGLNMNIPGNPSLVEDTDSNQKGKNAAKKEEVKEAKIFQELTGGSTEDISKHCTSPGSTAMTTVPEGSTAKAKGDTIEQKQGCAKEEGHEDERFSLFLFWKHLTNFWFSLFRCLPIITFYFCQQML